jgi:DNA repair exonuclease SbcCD nuclease subunit
MDKFILIGDMHVEKSNIEESKRLLDWIDNVAMEHKAKKAFLGDIHHTMSNVNTDVAVFWSRYFREQTDPSMVITGNHDMTNDGAKTILEVYADDAAVYTQTTQVINKIWAMPFIRDSEEFIKQSNLIYEQGGRVVLCHADINGASLENGFYNPSGVNPDLLPKLLYISGHIHKKQIIKAKNATIFFTGTPRHLIKTDIGEIKGIHVFDINTYELSFIPTPETVAEPFKQFTITEDGVFAFDGTQVKALPKATSRMYVDIKGSPEYIKQVLPTLSEDLKVRTFPITEIKKAEVSESMGINVAFKKYFDTYVKDKQVNTSAIWTKITDLCPELRG